MLQISARLVGACHGNVVSDETQDTVHLTVEENKCKCFLQHELLVFSGLVEVLPLLEEFLHSGLDLVRGVMTS